jgi:hypothetical protein
MRCALSACVILGNPGVRVYLVDEPPARCGGHRVVQRPVVTRVEVIGGLAGVLVAPERYEGDVGPGAGARRDAVQLPARDRVLDSPSAKLEYGLPDRAAGESRDQARR